ncbi:MAG TPA: sugar phosphate isomerase/epimerase family protein [Pedobacter sp.]
MKTGIFAKTFTGTLPEILQQVHDHGIDRIQFNFSITGLPSLPDDVDEEVQQAVQTGLSSNNLSVEAVSCTFNMIHPDPAERRGGLRKLAVIAAQCSWLGTNLVTLCTGSRNILKGWEAHPDNSSRAAWYDLRESLDIALMHAEDHDLELGIEPDTANVVSSVDKAVQLLKEVNSPRLKIIYDPANLFEHEPVSEITDGISYAIDQFGGNIVSVHAKDRDPFGEFVAAGQGILPYGHFLAQLKQIGYQGNLMLQGLEPAGVTAGIAFLQKQIDKLYPV